MMGACHFQAGNYTATSAAFKDLEEIALNGPAKKASEIEKWAVRRADDYYAAEAAGKPG